MITYGDKVVLTADQERDFLNLFRTRGLNLDWHEAAVVLKKVGFRFTTKAVKGSDPPAFSVYIVVPKEDGPSKMRPSSTRNHREEAIIILNHLFNNTELPPAERQQDKNRSRRDTEAAQRAAARERNGVQREINFSAPAPAEDSPSEDTEDTEEIEVSTTLEKYQVKVSFRCNDSYEAARSLSALVVALVSSPNDTNGTIYKADGKEPCGLWQIEQQIGDSTND